MKKYLQKNVYELAKERLDYIFTEFDNVLVAFSGGKDSTVCLHMCYEYAKEHDCLDKLAMYHLDYECQYEMTTNFVDEMFKKYSDIKRFWFCVPILANCGCSVDTGAWKPWDNHNQDIWVREMPNYDYVYNINNLPFEFIENEQDYSFQDRVSEWFNKEYGKTATVIGIRTQESLNRFRAITSERNQKYKGNKWINDKKAYPIYDWNTQDVWVYFGKTGNEYNKLYDLYYQAGLDIEQMRVANPFHSCGTNTLKLYKVIEPHTWGKMVSRVNGVNFTAIYGGTTAMGWKNITKPDHLTWKEYCYFLLDTLDEKTKQHYLEKLNTSLKFWKEKGGALTDETIKELEEEGVEFTNKGKVSKISSKEVVSFDDYLDDTNVTDFKSIPTYKRMCICIMKNDYYCKYMGFAQTKQEKERRQRAMNMYKNL